MLEATLRTIRRGTGRLVDPRHRVSEPTETVEDVYEPYLIQQGLLMRTPRGRVATPAAYAHLGMIAPPGAPLAADPDRSLFDT